MDIKYVIVIIYRRSFCGHFVKLKIVLYFILTFCERWLTFFLLYRLIIIHFDIVRILTNLTIMLGALCRAMENYFLFPNMKNVYIIN